MNTINRMREEYCKRRMNVLYYPLNEDILESDPLKVKLYKCGLNTGNLIWANAVKKNILYEELWRNDKRYLEDNIIIPMANDLNPYNSIIEMYRDKVLKSGNAVRVTILGLGTQLSEELNTPQKLVKALPDERIRALHDFSEHAKYLGIRGWITAECLDLMGIHNYKVIGCPSFYTHRNNPPKFGKATTERVCISWGGDWKKEQYIKELFRKNKKQGDALIMQSMEDLPKALFEDEPILERHIKNRYPDLEVDPLELFQYIKETAHMFFDEETWEDFLVHGKFTMATGCRFHGNMKAWLMGIPALWVVHDSRTRELCEVMKLPNISIGRAARVVEREEFTDFCNYDEDFYENYQELYCRYVNFLNGNDIKIRQDES